MSRVFVLNEVEHDFSTASEFGELSINPVRNYPVFNVGASLTILKNFISDYKEGDYLIQSGSPFIMGLAFAALLVKFESINVLLFDAKGRKYVPRTITRNQLVM